MEGAKKMLERLADKKMIRKDQCLIIVLAGVLLCIIAMPVKQNDSKSNISNIINDKVENHSTEDAAEDYGGVTGMTGEAAGDYAGYWEQRLEDVLRYVDGAGNVKVLITLKESEYKIVEKDGPEDYNHTEETDSAGGSRTIDESRAEKSTIYTTNESGQSVPYVVKTISPVVEGVVVIVQGANKQSVQDNIIEAIQVLFDIDANKIKIVKMKNNQ